MNSTARFREWLKVRVEESSRECNRLSERLKSKTLTKMKLQEVSRQYKAAQKRRNRYDEALNVLEDWI